MKMYTNSEQTFKLIELGFERPFRNEYLCIVEEYGYAVNKERNFSIGELIEMLPKTIEVDIWWGREKGKAGTWGLRIDTDGVDYMWTITYERDHSANLGVVGAGEELIDALYDMRIRLKEERVI